MLSYGVDKRLTYLAGQYEKATERFEESLKKFKLKSEIWVYLAGSYYYTKEPEKARQTLERAAAVMPDLNSRVWQPLIEGLIWEIRMRANQLQVQVDFYSQNPDDFLTLFRLYRFLQAYQEAAAVIYAAEGKKLKMGLAGMSSGANQRVYRKKAQEWRNLANKLRAELKALGVAVNPPVEALPSASQSAGSQDAELIEAARVLQLKVDFYQAQSKDYQDLFDKYILLDELDKATAVIKAVEREIQRVKLQVVEARDIQEELKFKDEVAAVEAVQKAMKKALEKAKGGSP